MANRVDSTIQAWTRLPPARFVGGNQIDLLQGHASSVLAG